jgi:hypothetical protein
VIISDLVPLDSEFETLLSQQLDGHALPPEQLQQMVNFIAIVPFNMHHLSNMTFSFYDF